VKIGFAAPVSGSWATREILDHVAGRAEQLGYHSLWTFQRLLSPVDGSWGEQYRAVQDPIATLAYLAARTERVRLGVAVVNLPFYAPIVLAKALTTVDILSAGRLDAGLGIGLSDEEFAAAGADKARRSRRAAEFIAVLKKIWADGDVEHEGEFYRVPRSSVEPKPVQRPHPPILLGGTAPAALRRAGRLCDGWISSSRHEPAELGESIAIVRAAAADAGRDPAALRFVCRGVVQVRDGGGGAGRRPLTGTLDQIRGDLDLVAEQGVTELFVDLNFDPEVGSPSADPAVSRRRADEVLEALAPQGPRRPIAQAPTAGTAP